MDNTAKLMNISIKEGESGIFFATSEDDPTFFVSAASADELWAAIPYALEDLFHARQEDYFAMETNKGPVGHRDWVMIPRSAAASRSKDRAESGENKKLPDLTQAHEQC